MRILKINETPQTPKVEFNAADSTITFMGRIMCEDAPDFFEPINNWLKEYELEAPDKTLLNIDLEYINTSSSKCLLNMMKRLEHLKERGKDVEVNWIYESDDDDMEEAGKDFHLMVNMPFRLVPKA
ncbi:MAG: DUF1987 domain-containing protein [Bacteroidia bacterium]